MEEKQIVKKQELPPLGAGRKNNNIKFELRAYKRGQVFFKIGLLSFTFIPVSVFYYMKYRRQIYGRGQIKDMERIHKNGKSIHQIPKYEANFKDGEAMRH